MSFTIQLSRTVARRAAIDVARKHLGSALQTALKHAKHLHLERLNVQLTASGDIATVTFTGRVSDDYWNRFKAVLEETVTDRFEPPWFIGGADNQIPSATGGDTVRISERPMGRVNLKIAPETFSRIYGREAQIRRVIDALQIGQDTNWTKRKHTLLSGPPGCISGNTHIAYVKRTETGKLRNKKGSSLRRLYEAFTRNEFSTDKYFVQSITDDGRVFLNRITDVVDSGMKETFQVTTETGKTFGATSDHEIRVADGYVPLNILRVGDKVYTNNRIDNLELVEHSRHPLEHSDIINKHLTCHATLETIVSIVSNRFEHVYDIVVEDPHRNFAAGRVFVHNCGKTELCLTLANALGEEGESWLWFDATSTTKAGALEKLMKAPALPPVLFVEEIEKCQENALRWLLGVMDERGEIRRTNYRVGNESRKAPLTLVATANNVTALEEMDSGAIYSRFGNRVYCLPPDREVVRKILNREISEIGGNSSWAQAALKFGFDDLQIRDCREIQNILLCGRDRLLSGEYQKDFIATMSPQDMDRLGLT